MENDEGERGCEDKMWIGHGRGGGHLKMWDGKVVDVWRESEGDERDLER